VHKVSQKLSDWTYKFISMASREFTVNVNRMKLCVNPKSWQPCALLKPIVQQDRVVCSRKLTVTIRSRLIPSTADAICGQQIELQSTP
jgi:hypothetical protein